MLECKAVLLVL
jgi:hypothetical protein